MSNVITGLRGASMPQQMGQSSGVSGVVNVPNAPARQAPMNLQFARVNALRNSGLLQPMRLSTPMPMQQPMQDPMVGTGVYKGPMSASGPVQSSMPQPAMGVLPPAGMPLEGGFPAPLAGVRPDSGASFRPQMGGDNIPLNQLQPQQPSFRRPLVGPQRPNPSSFNLMEF